MRRLLIAAFVLASTSATAETLKPAQRAKVAIDAQLAAFKQGLAGERTFLAMFDPKGVIIGDRGVMTAAELGAALAVPYDSNDQGSGHAMLAMLFGALPDGSSDREVKMATIGKLSAGGVADAVWFSFDLTEKMWVTKRFRISELLVERGGTWKIAVAHIGVPQADLWEDEEESAGDGPTTWGAFPEGPDVSETPLVHLATSPRDLARALSKDPAPVVLGTSDQDLGVGTAAAKKLVMGWAKLTFELGESIEQRTPTWGYAVVQVKLPARKPGPHGAQSMKLRASLVALPRPDGTWRVVTAQYSRIGW